MDVSFADIDHNDTIRTCRGTDRTVIARIMVISPTSSRRLYVPSILKQTQLDPSDHHAN